MRLSLERIEKTLISVKEESSRRFKAELIGIFGSFADRTQKPTSDLDILVRFDDGATLLDFVGLAGFLEEKLKVKVDVVPVDTLRSEIKSRVLEEAVYI
jgi:predicted nucleotidyltransferase